MGGQWPLIKLILGGGFALPAVTSCAGIRIDYFLPVTEISSVYRLLNGQGMAREWPGNGQDTLPNLD